MNKTDCNRIYKTEVPSYSLGGYFGVSPWIIKGETPKNWKDRQSVSDEKMLASLFKKAEKKDRTPVRGKHQVVTELSEKFIETHAQPYIMINGLKFDYNYIRIISGYMEEKHIPTSLETTPDALLWKTGDEIIAILMMILL